MAALVFAPPKDPSVGTAVSAKTRTFETQLGDGYSASGANGLNVSNRELACVWDGLSRVDASAIAGFFELHQGHIHFRYNPPPDFDAERKWVCKTWNRIHVAEYTDTVSATLVEVFRL